MACCPRAFSSVGRAAALQAAGHRFEPGSAHQILVFELGLRKEPIEGRLPEISTGIPSPVANRCTPASGFETTLIPSDRGVKMCVCYADCAVTQPNSETIRTPRSASYRGESVSVSAAQKAS